MLELQNKTRELLESGQIKLMIGYSEGFAGHVKPIFISNPASVDKLILDERCSQNLAVYLNKPEVKAYGKLGIIANFNVLKTILQLTAENQLKFENLVCLTVSKDGKLIQFDNVNELEDYVLKNFPEPLAQAKEKLNRVLDMSREDRWKFWVEELSNCIKCYACRAACPLCYCTKCIVEDNKPQWIPVPSTAMGNLEWHINRAMHLAGRCVGCNQCTEACPMDIPLNLLTMKLNTDVFGFFSQKPGTKATLDFALSTYKVNDKENFIR